MSEQEQGNPGRKPEFIAYSVKDGREGKAYFSRVGAAWAHRDGQGYDIALESVPVNGRITLREMREERMQEYAEDRADPQRAQSRERSGNRTRGNGRQR